jgi:four helix bundle protein
MPEEAFKQGEGDPIRRMKAYVLAENLVRRSWDDVVLLEKRHSTRAVSSQLYRAVGSIAANLGEGYSRSSGRDRARLFEYALGSARECSVWYECARPVVGSITEERLAALTDI